MFEQITSDPAILGGKPCIRGTRISVEFIMELMASGATRRGIVETYPQLTIESVEEAIRYAADAVRNERVLIGEVMLTPAMAT